MPCQYQDYHLYVIHFRGKLSCGSLFQGFISISVLLANATPDSSNLVLCLQIMAVPPTYVDLGKSAKDVFTKGYGEHPWATFTRTAGIVIFMVKLRQFNWQFANSVKPMSFGHDCEICTAVLSHINPLGVQFYFLAWFWLAHACRLSSELS